jgi:hypothetical protein
MISQKIITGKKSTIFLVGTTLQAVHVLKFIPCAAPSPLSKQIKISCYVQESCKSMLIFTWIFAGISLLATAEGLWRRQKLNGSESWCESSLKCVSSAILGNLHRSLSINGLSSSGRCRRIAVALQLIISRWKKTSTFPMEGNPVPVLYFFGLYLEVFCLIKRNSFLILNRKNKFEKILLPVSISQLIRYRYRHCMLKICCWTAHKSGYHVPVPIRPNLHPVHPY